MEQYDLPFNQYEDPTVELDFESDDSPAVTDMEHDS
jgi:hypothetical protein